MSIWLGAAHSTSTRVQQDGGLGRGANAPTEQPQPRFIQSERDREPLGEPRRLRVRWEGSGRKGLMAEEVSLPRSSVAKVAKEFLPAGTTLTKESCDLLVACCSGAALSLVIAPPPPHRAPAPTAADVVDFARQSSSIWSRRRQTTTPSPC